MDSPATTQDVAVRWRSLTDDEELKASVLLDDAWTLIKLRNATIEARITAATLDSALVVMVQCAMVTRVLRNPDGKRRETIEDYSYERADGSSDLFVTDTELALLDVVSSTSTAFTIRPWHDPAVVLETPWDVWA